MGLIVILEVQSFIKTSKFRLPGLYAVVKKAKSSEG